VTIDLYKPPEIEKTKEMLDTERLVNILYDVILFRISLEIDLNKNRKDSPRCIEKLDPIFATHETECDNLYQKYKQANIYTMIGFLNQSIPAKEALADSLKTIPSQYTSSDVSLFESTTLKEFENHKIDLNKHIITDQKIAILKQFLEKNKK
jgi:hypothetical protein